MATLDSIEVDGYKSIRSAKIGLGPINVLIGANGAGKSNLLSLFGLLSDLANYRLQLHVGREGGVEKILHFGSKRTSALRITLRFGQRAYEATLAPNSLDTLIFERESVLSWEPASGPVPFPPESLPTRMVIGPPGQGEAQIHGHSTGDTIAGFALDERARDNIDESNGATPVWVPMQTWRRFHFYDTGKTAPAKRKQRVDDNRFLRAEGENLAPFLSALKTIAPGAYRRIVEAVRTVAPFFDDFALAPDVVNPDVIQLAWRHKTDDALFTADSLSDGTLRFICLATLLLQPELPSLIVIDEPELGLHPFAIVELAEMVRAAAEKTQVLLATQSVTLLDQFSAGEVIVVERENGESTFRRLEEAALEQWKQDYSLGELWLKNVLGGRPR